MRRRIIIGSAGVALIILVGIVYWCLNQAPPADQNMKRASNQLKQDATNPLDAPQEPEEASATDQSIWLEALQHLDPTIRLPAAEKLGYFAPKQRTKVALVLLNDFQSFDPSIKVAARETLSRLRGKIVPALLVTAKAGILPVRDTVGEMLHHIGLEALPPLIAIFVGTDLEFRQFADHELHRWGPLAAQHLLVALQTPQYRLERPRLALLLWEVDRAEAGAATPHLLALLKEPNDNLRRQALEMLGRIGPKAEDASVVVAQLDDPTEGVRSQAATLLRQLGAPALPELRRLLINPSTSPKARLAALGVLGRLGPNASPAVPELVSILKDSREYLHHWAAQALTHIGPLGVAGLMDVVADRKASGWKSAAVAVSRLGPASKEIAPALGAVLKDKSLSLADRELLVVALENIEAEAVPTLAALAQTPGGAERTLAIRALSRLGPVAYAATPALAVALRHLPDQVSTEAAQALATLGAVGELSGALKAAETEVRLAAVVALSKIGPAASGATLLLSERLADPAEAVRRMAARTLGNIGRAAKDAIPGLQKTLSSEDKVLGVLAAGALLRIDPGQSSAVTLLRDALATHQRDIAAEMVCRLGAQAKEFAPNLQPLLKDQDARVRGLALEGLIQLDASQAKELLPLLLANRLDQQLADSLERLGPLAKEAIPVMRVALDNYDGTSPLELRLTFLRILQKIGPEAAPALVATAKRADVLYRKDPVLLGALRILATLGPLDKTQIEHLGDLVRNANELNPNVRVLAVAALASGGPDVAAALSPLKFALRDEDVLLRTRAAEVLGRIGPAARGAIEDLQILVERDPFPYVREVAAAALKKVSALK